MRYKSIVLKFLKAYFKEVKQVLKGITDPDTDPQELQQKQEELKQKLQEFVQEVGIENIDPHELSELQEELLDELKEEVRNTLLEVVHEIHEKQNKSFRDAFYTAMQTYNEKVEALLDMSAFALLSAPFLHADLRPVALANLHLSERLYRNAQELEPKLFNILNEHISLKGTIEELRNKIYRGYNIDPQNDILPKVQDLPDYLQQAIKRSGYKKAKLDRLINNIKTSRLRVAYKRLLDFLDKEDSKAFKKAFNSALEEKTKFYAQRIAQTETFRAINYAQMADYYQKDYVEFVKFELSTHHKVRDICDFYANLDLGYGKGVYPKSKARVLPLHPFCRCRYIPLLRPLKYGKERKFEEAEREFLGRLSKKEKHDILGTWKNVELWENGLSAEQIFNMSRKQYPIRPFEEEIGFLQYI